MPRQTAAIFLTEDIFKRLSKKNSYFQKHLTKVGYKVPIANKKQATSFYLSANYKD